MMHNIDLKMLIEQLEKREADDSLGEVTLSYRERENVVFYLHELAENKKEKKFKNYLITEIRENPVMGLDSLMRIISRGQYSEADHDFVCLNIDLLKDVLSYLKKLKNISEIPPLGKKPDYVPLSFHELANMIGEPVYSKSSGCKGRWEIVNAVRKTVDGEEVRFRGIDNWFRISDDIYRTKEGAQHDK